MTTNQRENLRNVNQPIMVKEVRVSKELLDEQRKERKRLGRMSRNKGKKGERDVANLFKVRKFDACRGVQYKGSGNSPDVEVKAIQDLFHIEVKRVEQFNLYKALSQAKSDAPTKIPIVAHRKNGATWVAIMELNRLIDLFQLIYDRVDWSNQVAGGVSEGEYLL